MSAWKISTYSILILYYKGSCDNGSIIHKSQWNFLTEWWDNTDWEHSIRNQSASAKQAFVVCFKITFNYPSLVWNLMNKSKHDWTNFLNSIRFSLLSFLQQKIRLMKSLCCLCVCSPFQVLNHLLTDIHEIW
jgi:hypothetical protein